MSHTLKNVLKGLLILAIIIVVYSVIFKYPIDYVMARTIPIPPQSSIVKMSAGSGWPDSTTAAHIGLSSNLSPDQLLNFYSTELEAKGWSRLASVEEGEVVFGKSVLNSYFRLRFSLSEKSQRSIRITISH